MASLCWVFTRAPPLEALQDTHAHVRTRLMITAKAMAVMMGDKLAE